MRWPGIANELGWIRGRRDVKGNSCTLISVSGVILSLSFLDSALVSHVPVLFFLETPRCF